MLTRRFFFHAAKQTRLRLRQNGLRGLATAPVPPTPASTDVIRKLLSIVSSDADLAEYKATYGTPGVRRTTVIKIGGEVLENEMDTLVESLTFLKEAGLFPILVHGAGPQMNDELEKAGVEPRYVQGNRYTDKTTLGIAKKVFLAANRKLVDALAAAGVPARPITSGVFEAAVRDLDVFGYVGEVDTIHSDAVRSALDAGQIPVLSCLGESKTGQLLNINADVAARELAITLQPHKTIFINAKGGWLEDGVKLPKLDMSKDYATMAARDYTGRQGTLLKLNEINTLLQALPSTSSVVLTSASALASEIVSGHSAGTVCIRGGDNVDAPLHFCSGKKKVGLMGARGYVGRELIRVLGGHPELDLVVASSRALVGQKVLDLATAPPLNPHTNRPATGVYHTPLRLNPELAFSSLDEKDLATAPIARDVDVWVLALPNGMCQQYATALDALHEPNQVVIDLSADQRFNKQWVYGLPETPGTRDKLRGATRISNPGCYATGAQLGVLPLLPYLDTSVPPHIFGVSGYSGAGTGLSPNNNEAVLHDNLIAYKSVEHIHEKEVSHQLGTRVAFMPHVAPWFQGIHLTLSLQLAHDSTMSEENVAALYQSFYATEPLVQVLPQGVPQVKANACKHHATIGGFSVDRANKRVALVVTIDNLLKGAASQAMQNINLALGMDERLGLH
ncbi:hypothetical protein SPRG_05439 [Saprolegnia parasitica CBS 223.65]|uniref:acetylglutamate kinase n=1 Tax=Saprolegnia parasitica (strain CBS 223.65) TaxID=695850 RepID=A0A067CRT7_SAPPC|nr:hypothetical protein SPRG_05439 [Saprolegnia parasitica CBS 223.65]KDO29216.1 hypothetical protein SPRG_05439 [Saprolegnia parasitica CBS 223.65]|eukprot:XP_012200074.1 hypothetical protein SPRG_05439 [Saprolegnia parasitica CBS 223.65]